MTKIKVSCAGCGYVNTVDITTSIDPQAVASSVRSENTDLLPEFATVSGSEPDANTAIGLMLGAALSEADGKV